MTKIETIIIGAGPSGLMAGANIPGSALILEKNSKPGLKLLISGSGQCNVSHSGSIDEFLTHFGKNSRFLKPALYSFSNNDVKTFFESLNIPLITRDDGKVFPRSFKSADILDGLLKAVKSGGNSIECNSKVVSVEKSGNGFFVKTIFSEYRCKNLIIAVGGKSYPSTGSTGDGYDFAGKLGHVVVTPLPGLTPVKIKNHELSSLSGISFSDIQISQWRENKKIRDFKGDLLITHDGLSGPVILNNSRYFQSGDFLKVRFADLSDDLSQFKNKIRKNGKANVKRFLQDFKLPQRMIELIIKISGISFEKNCADINNKELKQIYLNITSFPFLIFSMGGFASAMVTTGGVDLSSVNSKTMESVIHKGLFFTGEVLDIDGDTGGYNIHAALCTGFKAAETIKKREFNTN